jgi:hypothetical protein
MVWCWVARAFTDIRQRGADAGRESAAQVASIAEGLGGNRFWAEVAGWWTGSADAYRYGRTRWLGGEDAARERWQTAGPTSHLDEN